MADTFKNSYKVKEKDMVSLSVCNVGYQRCEADHRWGPGVRDHFLVHYVVSGKGIYECESGCFHLAAGDIFLIYPHSQVSYRADSRDPWEYYWVGFSGSDAAQILEATDFTKANPVIANGTFGNGSVGGEIKDHLYRIYESRGNEFVNAVEMTGRLYIMLALLVKGSSHDGISKRGNLSHVQKGIAYMEANYSYPISIDDVADYVGISRSQLFREFKIRLSKSPKEYLSEYRIRHSCQLLKNSNLTVSAIAASVGYENGMYYSKVFRKLKGLTPTEYREGS